VVEHAAPRQYDLLLRQFQNLHHHALPAANRDSLGFYISFITIVCARVCAAIMERRTRGLLLAAAERAS
jgi:hypothetical protein